MSGDIRIANRPDQDIIIKNIVDYIENYDVKQSELAINTAHYCLLDSTACALEALNYPACTKLLGPIVAGAQMQNGAKIFGTNYSLDPVTAAFNIGAMVRWLDFNDTWLAAEWGHPSDNLGAILALCDYISRQNIASGKNPILIESVLEYMIKAHEIQGVLALENSFNRIGYDHVFLVRLASTAVATQILGGSQKQIFNALSQAFIDGCALRTYRHAPNTGSRKSWAAGDASSRAVRLALFSLQDEMGYESALTAQTWGFNDVVLKGNSLKVNQDYGTYVMENILFKISFPAEFHAQTAVECAFQLYPTVKDRLDDIVEIIIETQESAVRIIDKVGELNNPADRDHCIQYMVAVGLWKGSLQASDYEDDVAKNPIIDQLRNKMKVVENPRFTKEYLETDQRSIGNAIQIKFNDGSLSEKVSIDYPVGHRKRREEGIPLLLDKFKKSLFDKYDTKKQEAILNMTNDVSQFKKTPVNEYIDVLVR